MPDLFARLTFAPGLTHWMVLCVTLFSIGLYGILCRRSAIGVLMSVELLVNSAALLFVVFNRHQHPAQVEGQVMAVFIIAVTAAETVLGMAIFMALYRARRTVDVNRLRLLKNDEVSP